MEIINIVILYEATLTDTISVYGQDFKKVTKTAEKVFITEIKKRAVEKELNIEDILDNGYFSTNNGWEYYIIHPTKVVS
jgi:hypothetical protein